MAIVFISPKNRQKNLLIGIIIFFVLVLVLTTVAVLNSNPSKSSSDAYFKKTVITINYNLLNSKDVQGLEPLPEIQEEYLYTGLSKDKKPVSGKVLAVSEVDAQEKLKEMNVLEAKIEKVSTGRENPFSIYYQVQLPTKKK